MRVLVLWEDDAEKARAQNLVDTLVQMIPVLQKRVGAKVLVRAAFLKDHVDQLSTLLLEAKP